ncbi:uncharacterized protein APUU_70258A [Aspergillus puulaauensis]|uniref:GATA-type domain-containing protein n=1 Tax=Aspergillus puulaauensis TaxID=1220207 RepID=A0A7R8AT92_9EURO|nr:uncharacterized protein APUU_70258A [Aspergillus puulaauensis]BCS28688.1 hypothetical protein APUU_70258A [Aspergillus puulaauensis]
MSLVVAHRVRVQMQSDRKNKLAIIYRNCGDHEQPNVIKKHNVSAELAEILCPACGLYYTQHKTHRPPQVVQHNRVSLRLNQDRQIGNPFEREICPVLWGATL